VCEAIYPRVSRDNADIPIRSFYFDGTQSDLDRDIGICGESGLPVVFGLLKLYEAIPMEPQCPRSGIGVRQKRPVTAANRFPSSCFSIGGVIVRSRVPIDSLARLGIAYSPADPEVSGRNVHPPGKGLEATCEPKLCGIWLSSAVC